MEFDLVLALLGCLMAQQIPWDTKQAWPWCVRIQYCQIRAESKIRRGFDLAVFVGQYLLCFSGTIPRPEILTLRRPVAAIIIMFALTSAGHIYCTIITKRNIKGIELSLISLKRKFYASNLILSILNARTAFLDISYTSQSFSPSIVMMGRARCCVQPGSVICSLHE